MDIATFIGDIADGIGAWLPELATTLVETFMSLFFTTSDGTTSLNTLGTVCLTFFIVGLGFRCLPAVLGWLRARWTSRKRRGKKRA